MPRTCGNDFGESADIRLPIGSINLQQIAGLIYPLDKLSEACEGHVKVLPKACSDELHSPYLTADFRCLSQTKNGKEHSA